MKNEDFIEKIVVMQKGVAIATNYFESLKENPEKAEDVPAKMQELQYFVDEITKMHPYVKTLDASQTEVYRKTIADFQNILTEIMEYSSRVASELGAKVNATTKHMNSAKAYKTIAG